MSIYVLVNQLPDTVICPDYEHYHGEQLLPLPLALPQPLPLLGPASSCLFIIYLQYFLIQNEAARRSELLMANIRVVGPGRVAPGRTGTGQLNPLPTNIL